MGDARTPGDGGVRSRSEQLTDAEATPALPSAALASHAAPSPTEQRRQRRRRTDLEIWSLAWPVILSQVLASMVSLIDIAMVGRLGRDAVAAVGYTTQFLWLMQSILFAIGIACVALMARAIGAREPERARQALAASLLLACGLAAVFTLVVLLLPRPLLRALQAEPSVVEAAVPYFRLTLGSTLLLAVSITLESGFRAVRNTRTPMWIAGVVTVVKTALNLVLIFGGLGLPRLELVGAGIATLLSQAVGLVLFVLAARRMPMGSALAMRPRQLGVGLPRLRELVTLSLPAVGERIVLNVAMMAYFALLGHYGSAAVAAYTVGVRLLSFSWIPGIGFSAAAATLVGQALGAGEPGGAARAGWRATRMALGVSVLLGAFFALVRGPLARAFTNDAAIVAELGPFMLLLALAQPFMGVHFTLGGALRGAGDTLTPLLAASLGNWVFRVPLAVLFSRVLGFPVVWVWAALVLDHIARALWLTLAFRREGWRARATGAEPALS